MKPRLRLALAAAAFLGWLGVLSYAALTKSHAPTVSRIQPAVASTAIVAELGDTSGKQVKVAEKLWGDGPAAGTVSPVANLSEAKGFTEPGKYLLYLISVRGEWYVVGAQRSPGSDGFGPPLIYAWSPDVEAQEKKLRPPAK